MRASAKAGTLKLGLLLCVLVAILAVPSGAWGFAEIAPPGESAGHVENPQGLAVDFETGDLYVADQGNNRVDVFDSTGAFKMAFGWGVDTGAGALETCTTASTCQKGIAGAGKGQFSGPTSIAVDNDPLSLSFHSVYVADFSNRRIEKFDVSGLAAKFLLTFGGGVNKTKAEEGKTSEENICTAASGDVCGAGRNGTGSGEFSDTGLGSKISVSVGPAGTVYVGDSRRIAENPLLVSSRLQKFAPAGTFILQKDPLSEGQMKALAVNSVGEFYAGTESAAPIIEKNGAGVRKYDPNGTEPELLSKLNSKALSVDLADDLFVGELSSGKPTISEYNSSENQLRRFGYGVLKSIPLGLPLGLAPHENSSGDIYASDGSRVIQLDFPPPGPVVFPAPCEANQVGGGKATLKAEVNPEGESTTVHFQYLTQAQFEAGEFSNLETKTTAESGSIGNDFDLHEASVPVTGLIPNTIYHCRVIATNEKGSATGEDGSFKTRTPEILATFSSPVGAKSAILNAKVNPWGIPAGGFFEYVTDADFEASGYTEATIAPVPPAELDFGAEEEPETDSASLTELTPCTLYHHHVVVVVEGEVVPPLVGPERTFRTFCGDELPLPDSRKYELVSPEQKNSAEVGVPGAAGGLVAEGAFVRIQASAGSGEAITFTSFTSFSEPKGAPGAGQYISRRSSDGWGTENISPFGTLNNPLEPPYRGFTPDLAFAGVVVSNPPCAEGAVAGVESLCLRDNDTGILQPLTIEPPAVDPGETFCTSYAGSSSDGKHVFFAANGAFAGAGAPVGPGFSLYEWTEGKLSLVSVLATTNKAAQPSLETAFGAAGGRCSDANKIYHDVVSADGKRVFWTFVPKAGQTRFLARLNGTETIQLDAKVTGGAGGAGPSGGGRFQAATPDGSAVFFTDVNPLVAGAHAGDLYRYDLEAATEPLEDLTESAAAAGVEGLLGTSDDGTYAYFVATSVLSGEEENANGEKAKAGKFNLYRWHLGDPGVHFIATLANGDENDWSASPGSHTARVSPDGHHLAFLSAASEALSGYDNTIAVGLACRLGAEGKFERGPLCPQAYLYSAETDELTCASCNPSGSRPLGPTILPGWSNPYEGPRYLSPDGSRLFFESFDTLSPDDKNAKRDVYEAEQPGTGTCSSEDPSFDPASGLCIALISSGEGEDETYLLDASADGRDAFFATRKRLVGWDVNDNYDVYDAREGGGFAEPAIPPPICVGEACRAPVADSPSPAPIATNTFSGSGNPKPRNPKSKKQKKKHRHKKQKHQKRRVAR